MPDSQETSPAVLWLSTSSRGTASATDAASMRRPRPASYMGAAGGRPFDRSKVNTHTVDAPWGAIVARPANAAILKISRQMMFRLATDACIPCQLTTRLAINKHCRTRAVVEMAARRGISAGGDKFRRAVQYAGSDRLCKAPARCFSKRRTLYPPTCSRRRAASQCTVQ